MPKSDAVYVGHMLDMARKVLAKLAGKTRADFDGDENLRLAVTHLLQVIGEAASRVSSGFREQHPELPWRAIVGMRNKVVHDYLDVDDNAVWDTATQDLGSLVEALARIVPPEDDARRKEEEEEKEEPPAEEKVMLTTAQAASELRVSVRRIEAMITAGRLKASRLGRDWLIEPRALDGVRVRKPGRPPTRLKE